MNTNPILAELTRGDMAESIHRGAGVVVDVDGTVLLEKGDITRLVFPRSAIKALQAIPLVESGAAAKYGFTPEEIAMACSSHNGEPRHVKTVRSMLDKAGVGEIDLECGTHWPLFNSATRDLASKNLQPSSVHNNCSGKHAGMLATAKFLGEDISGYVSHTHPVQKRIASILSDFCDSNLETAVCGIDGCSVPTWAIALKHLALGFARFANSGNETGRYASAGGEIIAAVRTTPFMVAGSDRFCTTIMNALPRLFAKTGAEGVFCGAIPHAGIGIAVKCDDGASRAAEVIFAKALSGLDVWSSSEQRILAGFSTVEMRNRNGMIVGELRAC